MKIVLAYGSPRRRELLSMLEAEFEVIPAKGEEKTEAGLTPAETVVSLAKAKAEEVAFFCGDALVIAADTVVSIDGDILGKPASHEEAAEMLCRLSGRTHEVYTGLCIRCGGKTLCGFEETMVRFKALEPSEIESYAKTDEPMDKAGAYGIQGKAAVFVEGINGDFYNVMGLPLCRLDEMLKQMGVRLI